MPLTCIHDLELEDNNPQMQLHDHIRMRRNLDGGNPRHVDSRPTKQAVQTKSKKTCPPPTELNTGPVGQKGGKKREDRFARGIVGITSLVTTRNSIVENTNLELFANRSGYHYATRPPGYKAEFGKIM